jgi:hypothetical protein
MLDRVPWTLVAVAYCCCCGWFIDCLSKRTPLLNGLGFSGTSY